ncbi:cobalt ECF transporter T component CbiQ [Treponema sp. R80B11-R83G3]
MKNKIYELYALEELASGSTCIHRLNPLAKLLSAAVFIVTVVSFNRYAMGRLIPYIFYPALLMALSETPYSMLLKRFLVALPFCLFAGISNIIFDRNTAFLIGDLIVSRGVISFFSILFKTYLCVMAVLILVFVTRFSELTNELRRLRLPGIFIVMFELTYRYIGVLLNEAYSMSIAYSLRSPNRKGIEMRDMGSFAGQLLIRSFDRAERVYNAMKCKGYNIGYTSGYAFKNIQQGKNILTLHDIVFFTVVSVSCITFRIVDINMLLNGFLGRLV